MDKQSILENISDEMTLELKNILEFWSSRAVDNQFGGFVGQIHHNGVTNTKASKGAVLNARILWTFSAAYKLIGSEKLKKMADRAYKYLVNNFWDAENGGLIWEVDYNGKPLNTRKQAYAQGFGIYAFSEYYRASGNTESLDFAQKLYYLLEDNFQDKEHRGYVEALDAEWKPMADMRLSEKDANYPKTMNTHLHILEPYTNLYRVYPDEDLKWSILDLLDIFQTKIIDEKTGHFNLFCEMDWTCQSHIVSFGHDIEGAWLLHEAAQEINEPQITKGIQRAALNLVDITLKEGIDIDASVFNEREGDYIDTDKHWWPQAEAMVGLMDAYEISGNKTYIIEVERVWKFIKDNIIDYENGEWYWRVNKSNEPITNEDKAGFWKCPYHNSRALMEMITRIDKQLNRE
ncbi:AGE family epimerase/isomerase [uncultured Draconibacterium sp.]|uniref:AGE family epimerase/isomerase n=1 Tax=uncultured Draconibacterium sp. TaxID=1573823 RepID=UPI0029BFC3B6|nr:AGE family epimerase/isomerase [uncultured Draconibacterium sp.]